MATAVDVANFFIDLFRDTPDPMTYLRLEKFVYEAQAWSTVKLGGPLFSEDIEAWDYGPVIPSVYNTFKGHGRNQIRKVSGEYSSDVFTAEQVRLLIDISRNLGRFATGTLVDRTHTDGSPWEQVHVKGRNNTIPLELIRDHYSKHHVLDEFDAAKALKNIKQAGPRDPEGRTIFPKDWDD
ncbi:MAG: DUF4065 domain-containing protein [Methanomassiliicoccaceae archaeon]|nr:DUF4065 domain-containing protein [Methanomassiliicoccaceae archaeon]